MRHPPRTVLLGGLGMLSWVSQAWAGPDPRPDPGFFGEGTACIAHRGGAAIAPENTMAAFRGAAERGVAFELDVTLSADGEVIVIHDDTVDRTTNGEGLVRDMSADTLSQLDAGSFFHADFAQETVPTLAEVLDAFGGRVPINIELKTTSERAQLASAVASLVEARELSDQVFVTSFDPLLLEAMRTAAPELYRGQLVSQFRDADLSGVQKMVLRNMWLNGRSQPDAIVAHHVMLSAGTIQRWQKKGYRVLTYTVNDPDRMRTLMEWGIDAIITDDPDALLELRDRLNGGP